jgi:hypothetical protein
MAALVVFTRGDQRPPAIEGVRPPTAPTTMEELFRRRAAEIRPGADIQSFADLQGLVSYLNRQSSSGRTYEDIVFVGHGNAGVFALAGCGEGSVERGTFRASATINFSNPDAGFVQAVVAASPLRNEPVQGDGGVTGVRQYHSLDVHVEACRVGSDTFGQFQAALERENVTGSITGYRVNMRTTWRGSTRLTDIAPAPPNQFRPSTAFLVTHLMTASTLIPVPPSRP